MSRGYTGDCWCYRDSRYVLPLDGRRGKSVVGKMRRGGWRMGMCTAVETLFRTVSISRSSAPATATTCSKLSVPVMPVPAIHNGSSWRLGTILSHIDRHLSIRRRNLPRLATPSAFATSSLKRTMRNTSVVVLVPVTITFTVAPFPSRVTFRKNLQLRQQLRTQKLKDHQAGS